MNKYVKTDYVPKGCDYLTVGKVYKVIEQYDGTLAEIVCDNEKSTMILYSRCEHLDHRPWTVWEE